MITNRARVVATLTSVWVAAGMAFVIGCDLPVPAPTTADGRPVKSVVVNPADPAELAAAEALLSAEAEYGHALNVLGSFYTRTGAYDKGIWAGRERKNLREAMPWRYEGLPAAVQPPAQSLEGAKEAALAEKVVSARRAWLACLGKLEAHYQAAGMKFKLALVRNVRRRFDPVRVYQYFLHAEVPPANLRPTDVIPAAEALFAQALKVHKAGKPLPAVTDYGKQRKALGMFLRLVDQHPTSTKIALSAYYIGDIYKEYFNENIRAVQWYQRAWEWDPEIMKPARFQAAVVYDLRLAQHGKALRLYQEVLKHEQFSQSNVAFATDRIAELTGAK